MLVANERLQLSSSIQRRDEYDRVRGRISTDTVRYSHAPLPAKDTGNTNHLPLMTAALAYVSDAISTMQMPVRTCSDVRRLLSVTYR